MLVGASGAAGVIIGARQSTAQVERVPDMQESLAVNDGPAENFLLVGSDSREGTSDDDPNADQIGTESEVTGRRSDTIMILRREKDGGAALLSLPRDLWVPISGTDHSSKINSAYNEGAGRLARTVTEALGIPIHHYVEIDFQGFQTLVDAIGGIELCVPNPARDTKSGLALEPGCQEIDGTTGLAYARSRTYEEFVDGDWQLDGRADLGRIERQQLFIRTAVNEVLGQVRDDPFALGDLIDAGAGAVRLDESTDPLAAAEALRAAAEIGLATYTLPVDPITIGDQSALELAEGADAVLAYFNGTGPQPAPDATVPG